MRDGSRQPPRRAALRIAGLLTTGLAMGLLTVPPAHGQGTDGETGSGIGRLFSTVEERIRLDEIRDRYEHGKPPPRPARSEAAAQSGKPPAPVVPQVTINGVVLRSSGNDASWINGTRILAGQASADGIRVVPSRDAAGGGVRLILPGGSDTPTLKPGQRIDVATGTVVDSFQSGEHGVSGRFVFRAGGGDSAPVHPVPSPSPGSGAGPPAPAR